MIQIDAEFLAACGFKPMPTELEAQTIERLKQLVFKKVGIAIASRVESQYPEVLEDENFEFSDEWLEANIPDYQSIIDAETESLKSELIDKFKL